MSELEDLIGLPESTRRLTPLEEKFCQLYAVDGLSGNAAYRQANSCDLPATVIGTAVYRLQKRPAVKARIAELRREQATQLIMTRADVLNGLARIAMFDPRNLYDENGDLLPIHELDDVTAASIVGIKAQRLNTPTAEDPTKTTLITADVKLADKKAALDSLAKAMGLFTDKIEHSGPNGTPLIPEYSQTDIARRVAFLLTTGLREKELEQKK